MLRSAGKISLLAFLGSISVSCQKNSSSHLKVTNGVEANSSFGSVVKLARGQSDGEATCTGTFIGSSTILTAAHCLGQPQSQNVYVETVKGDIKTLARIDDAVIHPLYDSTLKISAHDLAIVHVSLSSANQKASTTWTFNPVKAGDDVQVVGFGNSNEIETENGITGSGSGTKRVGSNTVFTIIGTGLIVLVGTDGQKSEAVEEGVQSASGNGDSGGPLLKNGQLVGVTIGGGLIKNSKSETWKAVSYFASLSDKDNADFIAKNLK